MLLCQWWKSNPAVNNIIGHRTIESTRRKTLDLAKAHLTIYEILIHRISTIRLGYKNRMPMTPPPNGRVPFFTATFKADPSFLGPWQFEAIENRMLAPLNTCCSPSSHKKWSNWCTGPIFRAPRSYDSIRQFVFNWFNWSRPSSSSRRKKDDQWCPFGCTCDTYTRDLAWRSAVQGRCRASKDAFNTTTTEERSWVGRWDKWKSFTWESRRWPT